MGLIFSKIKKITPENKKKPAHSHHASTVSFDFESAKGQMRALRAFDARQEKKLVHVVFEINPNKKKRQLKIRY